MGSAAGQLKMRSSIQALALAASDAVVQSAKAMNSIEGVAAVPVSQFDELVANAAVQGGVLNCLGAVLGKLDILVRIIDKTATVGLAL